MTTVALIGNGSFSIGYPGRSGLAGIQNPGKNSVLSANTSKITALGSLDFGGGSEEVYATYKGYFRYKGKGRSAKLKSGTINAFSASTTNQSSFNMIEVTGISIPVSNFRYGDAASIERSYLTGPDTITGSTQSANTIAYLHEGDDLYTGYSGLNIVDLGQGNDSYISYGGNANITGGTGVDTYRPHFGDGYLLINDFEPLIDKIQIGIPVRGIVSTNDQGVASLGIYPQTSTDLLAVLVGVSSIDQVIVS